MLQPEPISQKAVKYGECSHTNTNLLRNFPRIYKDIFSLYLYFCLLSLSVCLSVCLSVSLSGTHMHALTHTHTHIHTRVSLLNFFHCRQDKYLSVNTRCFMLKVFHPLKIFKCNGLVQSILINCRFRADNREVQQERRREPWVSILSVRLKKQYKGMQNTTRQHWHMKTAPTTAPVRKITCKFFQLYLFCTLSSEHRALSYLISPPKKKLF